MKPTYPRLIPDRDKFHDWYLDEDVIITLQNGNQLHISKGFRFDSHSVPWPITYILPRHVSTLPGTPNDTYAALVHDALISLDNWHRYNRKFEDTEYKRFMNMPEYKISRFRSYVMPIAVRLYGWLHYDIWGDNRGIPKNGQHITICTTENVTI